MKRIRPSEMKKQALNELLSGQETGGDILSEVIRLSVEKTLQEVLESEQDAFLERQPYERSTNNRVYRNGYERSHIKTNTGVIEVHKPQIRGSDVPYRSQLWERFQSTSEDLRQLVIEMYARGLSTRDIEQTLEKSFGGFMLSRSSVSRITEELFEEYEQFKKRDLSGFDVVYVFLDAVYEPLRRYGSKIGVLCCWGYLTDGSKVLIDLTTANSESIEACRDFLRGMIHRGLRVPLTVTTDGAKGLTNAVEMVWPQSKRVRCWFHKMQNLQAKVPYEAWPEFKSLVIDVRDSPSIDEGKRRLNNLVERYEHVFPEACRCLKDDADASLNHIIVPERHRAYVRTTNLIERSFVEERRRTKTIPHMWDEKSTLKLVFAVLYRLSERWAHPEFSVIEERMVKQIRNQVLSENLETNSIRNPTARRTHVRAA